MRIFGLILAGGQGRRMGGRDKAFVPFAGVPLIAHVVGRLGPQVEQLAISANGDPARFARLSLDDRPVVLADPLPGFAGPLAGLLAGLTWARDAGADVLVTTAVDTPLVPCDLVPRLLMAAEGAASGVALADCGGRLHPAAGLWPVALADRLAADLAAGERRLGGWGLAQGAARAVFPLTDPDGFANLNTPDDLAAAEAALCR